jgi:hypothetical protein
MMGEELEGVCPASNINSRGKQPNDVSTRFKLYNAGRVGEA